MGRAFQGRRLTGPLLLLALLLLATHVPTATARGLRKDTEEQQQQGGGDKQQILAASTTTIPPVIEQAAAEPLGAVSSADATEAATALEAELDLSQLPDNEALKSLHEDMLISLMSDSSASSSLPASSSSSSTPGELDLSQVPDNEALKSLHEDMLISLMSDTSASSLPSSSSSNAHRQAFVPQSDAGHRRLQFGGGIPGVGNIGGLMNMGNQAFNAARTGANVINQGVNVVRQGASTAQEMNQVRSRGGKGGRDSDGWREDGRDMGDRLRKGFGDLRQDYERRCNLYPGEAEALYGKSAEELQQQQQQQQQGGRQLQQLLNMGANALKRGAMAYGRDAACPSEEQRQQYLQLKKGATKAYDTVVAPVHGSKELEQQQYQQEEQQKRMLLQQKVRKVEVEGGREGGLAYMHRQARAAYPRRFLLDAGKKAIPGPVEGGEVVARQEEFKSTNNAIEKSNKNAEWLKEMVRAMAREGGKVRVSWDDLDDLDIYDNSNEEHDDRGAGPF